MAHAAGTIPELEGPITKVVASISGPIAISIATLVLIGAGFLWASSEGLAFHRLSNMVVGIAIALFAGTLIATIWGRTQASPVVPLLVSRWALLLEDLVDLGVWTVLAGLVWQAGCWLQRRVRRSGGRHG
jgi:type IV secretory pathway VirB2 component (pilin)